MIIGNVEGVHANIQGELEVQSDQIIHETENETMLAKASNIVPEARSLVR